MNEHSSACKQDNFALGRARAQVRPECLLIFAWFLAAPTVTLGQSPFAARVLDFRPAPGQFVNVPQYMDPNRALGAPVGGGTVQPDNSHIVSLGGFGGSLTLAFDHTVRRDPANPFGLDCIVYGNATWVGGEAWRKWAECGMLEISRDVNGNGLPDDPWYLIPGTHVTNPAAQWQTQTWDDNCGDPTYPPANCAWVPPGFHGVWTTSAERLPPEIFELPTLDNPGGPDAVDEVVWGYADTSPTLILGDLDGDNIVDDPNMPPELFFTRPDNPLMVGVTPGAGGGDAFSIDWAIDAQTGQPALLDGFDFIRITTTANVVLGPLGEKSTEVGGIAAVRPGQLGDEDGDGRIDFADFTFAANCLLGPGVAVAPCPCRVQDFDQDGDVDLLDFWAFQAAFTGTGP